MGVVLELLLFAIVGGAFGLLCMKLTEKLISVRVSPGMNVLNINNRAAPFLWAFGMAVLFCFMCFMIPSYINRVEYALIMCAIACIAMVDISIRRIPNELLLAIITIKVISILVSGVLNGFDWKMFVFPIVGMVIGLATFLLPSLIHLYIGNGDIKYGAVIGFYFGFYGFLQSMVLMGIAALFYYIILRLLKKGDMKTRVPMGPFLSLGVLITIFFPFLNSAFVI